MSEKPSLEINQPVDVLSNLRRQLDVEKGLAGTDLHNALGTAGISPDIAGIYEKLEPPPGKWRWPSLIGGIIVSTFGVSMAGRLLSENPASMQEAVRIILDNFVAWAGTSIDRLEAVSIILGVTNAAVWTFLPPWIYERVIKQEAARVTMVEEHREGKANLAGKLSPCIQIDVGKADPSALLLTRLFHLTGKEVVTFWDDLNLQFSENPYWQRTRNDWTNTETLKRGDIQETELSVTLVSNGDDVFLSSRSQDPTRQAQDMTDAEAIGTVNARDVVRKQMGFKPIHHILVTNPQRLIEIDVARGGSEAYHPKTVRQVVAEKYPNVHLVDPDQLIVQELANIAAPGHFPLELVTNKERREEYEGYLTYVVEEHNQRVDRGLAKDKIRIATQEDGNNTLTIMYGSTDEDTIASVQTYGDEFSQEGELVVIINDPEKVNRLPEEVKYICVGTVVAEAVYQEFSDLVKQGEIKLG